MTKNKLLSKNNNNTIPVIICDVTMEGLWEHTSIENRKRNTSFMTQFSIKLLLL